MNIKWFIPHNTLSGRPYYHYPHFPDEEMEAQSGYITLLADGW